MHTLAGFTFMVIGMMIILLQPFKSTNLKVNTYHTLLPFIMATGCFTVTLIDEAEGNACWMIRKVVPMVGIFYVSPILAITLYAAYKYCRRCHKIWIKRNPGPELQNLVIDNINRKGYQAINKE